MNINGLSITELKQLLAQVNQDISSIKKAERRANNIKKAAEISELALCNKIAASFTGNNNIQKPVENAKIKADIAIQKDILEYLNNGGHIICSNTSGRISSKSVRGAKSGLKLYRKFAV